MILLLSLFTSCKDSGLQPPTTNGEQVVTVDDFKNIPSLDEMVIYQVNIRAISPLGTFEGVESRLENIAEMGANVVWLMPIYPIGKEKGINSPYAVSDYMGVNPEFGSLNSLKKLINAIHAKGMAVILDWVANHTAWDNPWIKAHPDWYAQDSNGNIISPPGTGWNDVAELNYDNEQMRQEMIKSMKYWLDEAGVDGFRCDAADFVPADFWQEAINGLQSGTDKELILMDEGSEVANLKAGFEMDYAWDFNTALKNVFGLQTSAISLITTHQKEYAEIPAGKQKMRYITNHDVYSQESPTDDFGGGSVAAFVITSYLGGVPLIYDGQEVARSTVIDFFKRDPIDWSLNQAVYDKYVKVMAVWREILPGQYDDPESYTTSNVVVFTRKSGGKKLLIISNVRETSQAYTVPSAIQGTWQDEIKKSSMELGTSLSLDPYEYLILTQ